VAHITQNSCGQVRSENSERLESTEVPPVMTLMLGICEMTDWAGADNDMTPSCIRLFLQYTKRPSWERKSAPMRGCVTSATTNRHVKSHRNPRLRLRGSHQ
jgi:hypothetical protein